VNKMAEKSKKPAIRFAGFTDAWEQRKLGSLAIFNPKAELPNVFEYVDLESVVGTEMLSHRTESKRTAPSRAQRLAQTGDLFYQTVRPYQKNNFLFEKSDKYYVFSTGYAQMRPVDSLDVVMLGNSLTEMAGDWNVLLKAKRVRNRGISGDDATGMINRLQQITPGKPKAIFLMVGINDLSHDLTPNQVYDLCVKVISKITKDTPKTKLYVQSLLPIYEASGRWKTLEGKTNDIPRINELLKTYCEKNNISYINLFDKFVRHGTNEMRKELTSDGLHLSPFGYKIWSFELRKYFK